MKKYKVKGESYLDNKKYVKFSIVWQNIFSFTEGIVYKDGNRLGWHKRERLEQRRLCLLKKEQLEFDKNINTRIKNG